MRALNLVPDKEWDVELDEATAKLLATGRNVSEVAESFETIGHSLQRQQRQREANLLFQLVIQFITAVI